MNSSQCSGIPIDFLKAYPKGEVYAADRNNDECIQRGEAREYAQSESTHPDFSIRLKERFESHFWNLTRPIRMMVSAGIRKPLEHTDPAGELYEVRAVNGNLWVVEKQGLSFFDNARFFIDTDFSFPLFEWLGDKQAHWLQPALTLGFGYSSVPSRFPEVPGLSRSSGLTEYSLVGGAGFNADLGAVQFFARVLASKSFFKGDPELRAGRENVILSLGAAAGMNVFPTEAVGLRMGLAHFARENRLEMGIVVRLGLED